MDVALLRRNELFLKKLYCKYYKKMADTELSHITMINNHK